ncbi:MAG: glutamine--fructose-6-phosphate transaminase (isomerizing) [Anaerolineaceae bacterium]|nr:glutamine--fructose-6-phosphate transaminase (isomerizing) [Anaerolineaceae bacterium]|tara:strand:+ start:645 stop:2486 length:1842 start_codon:yes stop_codon:yes gene_type:complete
MCGIVAYIGPRDATPIIMNGLKRLEYRGYDSAGMATIDAGTINIRRDAGKLARLQSLVSQQPLSGNIGIGHTRWATHGEPNERNAHPHMGATGKVVLVHNGIVENYMELRKQLIADDIKLQSDTDSEVIVHLVERYLSEDNSLEESVHQTIGRLQGANAIVLISTIEPDKIIAARVGNAGGIAIGEGNNEMFIASDMPAILEHTRRIAFLEPGWLATVDATGFVTRNMVGDPTSSEIHNIPWDPVAAEKGNYRHFMQKEIHEQVRAITDTIGGRIDFRSGKITLPDLTLTKSQAKNIDRIVITACGTAAHAGMVGKTLIEELARIPVEVSIASEFRYSNPIVDEHTIVLAISQSGETADTLGAMNEAHERGATLWSIVNVIGSQAMRMASGCIPMQAGPEIGVASTKAFTTPLVDLYLLAILLGHLRGELNDEKMRQLAGYLALLPQQVGNLLSRDAQIKKVALTLRDMEHCLYLGRGIQMPIAYEGALKLKEISYVHAEGYPAGEMKHGPIALIDKNMPVVAIATRDQWYEKMISQLQQARSRGGPIVIVATDGDETITEISDKVLWVPKSYWMLSPVLTTISLQLLAYHIAVLRGCDVDQPRNLAKSVTVE